ncbi:MAG TPA: polysaccharide deacetylase family protein [Patescibacteria group bacterium]
MKKCITSWDDGHPLDIKLATILLRFNIPAIFYIPLRNREGKPILRPNHIRWLSQYFDIGGHTYHHVDLTTVPLPQAHLEIKTGKDALEQIIGRSVTSFCYPRGHFTLEHQQLVRELGFHDARTARIAAVHTGFNSFARHPNWHFYPHPPWVRAAHCIKQRDRSSLTALPFQHLGSLTYSTQAFAKRIESNTFHIWGHSWELEQYDLWQPLTSVLEHFSKHED